MATAGLLPNGVEGEVGMLLGWADGRFASEAISFRVAGPGRQLVAGTQGWVDVKPRFHRAETLVWHPSPTVWRTGARRTENRPK